MIELDHLIVPVAAFDKAVSFYRDVLGFEYLGRNAPFEIFRVNASLTLDLMENAHVETMHLAFACDAATFAGIRQRLRDRGVAVGSDVFDRDNVIGKNPFGARGTASAFYFFDPDGHNLEARCYR
jgi:glyoxylase I family protein